MPAATSSSSFIWRCVAFAGCSTQVRASATCVAMAAIFRFFMNTSAAARPPLGAKLTTPQLPFGRYFCASSYSESPGSEGWRTHATLGWLARCCAIARPFLQCCGMRRCRLSRLELRKNACCGDWIAPKSRISCAVHLVMNAPSRPNFSA